MIINMVFMHASIIPDTREYLSCLILFRHNRLVPTNHPAIIPGNKPVDIVMYIVAIGQAEECALGNDFAKMEA